MSKTLKKRFNVAGHLRTPKEMAAYFEASLKEAQGDAAVFALKSCQTSPDLTTPTEMYIVPGKCKFC